MLIDFTDSDDDMIQRQATETVACGDFTNWDHAYETLWDNFEYELTQN